ncbi:MAG: leucine-rich repeat protein, partial [Burkholderiales bacterium]
MVSADLLRSSKFEVLDKKPNPLHVNNYNGLGRSLFSSNSIDKDEILGKLRAHPERGKLLAHLVNFKMYRTMKYNDIKKQNYELNCLKEVLNNPKDFLEVQELVRNRSFFFQRKLPSHFRQALIDLIINRGEQYQEFLDNLLDASRDFLAENEIHPTEYVFNILTKSWNAGNSSPDADRCVRKVLETSRNGKTDLQIKDIGEINTLPINAFSSLSCLKKLEINNNQKLTNLSAGVFNGLTDLEELTITNNSSLTSLPAGVFSGLVNLRKLIIGDNNKLTRVFPNTFNELANLKLLKITSSPITVFNAGIFNGLVNLADLEIEYIKIANLPAGIFKGLVNLKKLKIYKCFSLTTISAGAFDGLSSLEELEIIETKITNLSNGAFKGLVNLKKLKIYKCFSLTTISAGAFNG